MKLILKYKKFIIPIISIIVLIFCEGKKPAIYKGMLNGIPIVELCILFVLFVISLIMQVKEIYNRYKSENGKLPIKELLFSIIVVVISIIVIFNILKIGVDIINVNNLKTACEEKVNDYIYNLVLDGYSKRLNIEYEDFQTDFEEGTYNINYRIKGSGLLIFKFERESKEMIEISMMIDSSAEKEYKSLVTLQSAILVTWDKDNFDKEYANDIIWKMLINISEQKDETIKGCSFEKGNSEVTLSYWLDMWWELRICKD